MGAKFMSPRLMMLTIANHILDVAARIMKGEAVSASIETKRGRVKRTGERRESITINVVLKR